MKNEKWTIWVLFVWLAVGLLMAFFDRPIVDALWVAAGFVYFGWLAVGVVLAVILAVYGFRNKNNYAKASAIGFVFLGSLLIYQSSYIRSIGENIVVRYRFDQHFSEYERIVSEAKSGTLPTGHGESNGIQYQIDSGSPIRVAFLQPGSILDNWEGIIYDPTGDVLKAKGWIEPGQGLSAPSEVVRLFGGDLVSCTPLSGNYYRCQFT